MPEPEDTPIAAPEGSNADAAQAGADPQEGHTSEPYLGTYRTREEAEKGMAEAKQFADRMKAERDEALQSGTKIQSDLLTKLASIQAAQAEAPTPLMSEEDFEKWDNGDAKYQLGYVADLQRRLVEETAGKEEVTAMKEEFAAQLAALQAQVKGQSPDFLKHRETVNELSQKEQFANLGPDALLEVAKVIDAAKGPAHDPRDEVPGTTGSPRAGTEATKETLSADQKAYLAAQYGASAEEIAKLGAS